MSRLTTVQQTIAAILAADARPASVAPENWPPIFDDPDPTKKIPIITQEKGNLSKLLAAGLQKIGVGVVVMLPAIKFPKNETRQIGLALRFAVVVTENPMTNKTGKAWGDIVERAIELLHFKPNGVSLNNGVRSSLLSVDRNAADLMEPTAATAAFNNYIIAVNTEINLSAPLAA
jgi:hypothetical protein